MGLEPAPIAGGGTANAGMRIAKAFKGGRGTSKKIGSLRPVRARRTEAEEAKE